MANNKEFEERIKSESRATRQVTNDILVCKDCVYKFDDTRIMGNTSRCMKYGLKPNKVLIGGKCDEYFNG